MIDSRVNLTEVLKDFDFEVGRIASSSSYKGKSFGFSMTVFHGTDESLEAQTVITAFALDDKFIIDLMETLSKANLTASIDNTGISGSYVTYQILIRPSIDKGVNELW